MTAQKRKFRNIPPEEEQTGLLLWFQILQKHYLKLFGANAIAVLSLLPCAYFVYLLVQTGDVVFWVVGLALFVVPALYVLFRLLTLFLKSRADGKKPVILLFVIIADIGIAITGFSNTLNITYCYWLMLGLSYSIYFHYKGIWKENLITGVENENR